MEVTELQSQPSIEESKGNDNVGRNKIIELINTNRPALIIEYLFGIFRFRVHNNKLVPITKTMKLFCVSLTTLFVALFSIFLKLSSAINGTAEIEDMIDEVPSVVILIHYVVAAIRTSLFYNEGNIRILTTLSDLDDKLYVNTNQEFYKKSHTVTMRIVFVMLLIHVVVSVLDLLTDGDEIEMSKIVVLPMYMVQSLEISVFCLLIMMLTRRLNVVNNYLLKFVDEKDSNKKSSVFIVRAKQEGPEEFNLIGQASPDNMKIRDLAVTYDIIGETCALINEVFNFQIFMTLVATFTYVVITIWTGLGFYRHTAGDNTGPLVTIILWCITAICVIAFMSMTCEKLLLSRNETKVLVNKIIMDYDLPKTMRVQAKAFMELIEAWPLRIFIYDMFSVDITLMLKYISVATTYLIVIIQISHFI